MDDAVEMAAKIARTAELNRPGVVLLSPGCASYDAYTSYVARGDDFIRSVNTLREGAPQ
jgi:UDP-N-acetylmuramoylalanine--D-glutamate ligase